MVRILSIPMISTSVLSGFFFVFYAYLGIYTRDDARQRWSYLLFSLLSFLNAVYASSFAVFLNSGDNLELLNISNRIIIISGTFLLLSTQQFNRVFFDLPGKGRFLVYFSFNVVFSVLCLFDSPLFFEKKLVLASKYYMGLQTGIFFKIWGAYVLLAMFHLLLDLFRGYRQQLRSEKKNVNHLLLLILATSVWVITGILDTLTAVGLIDLPPLTWIGALLQVLSIELILVTEISFLYSQVKTLYAQVIQDSTTAVFTKRYFEVEFDRVLGGRYEPDVSYYLVLVDIDNFKDINDSHGHLAGDVVLRRIAEIMKNGLRPMDLVARFGGDEFVLLLSHNHSVDSTVQIVERIRFNIAKEEFSFAGKVFNATCSFGISIFKPGLAGTVESREDIINNADQALYQVKQGGKNKVYVLGA